MKLLYKSVIYGKPFKPSFPLRETRLKIAYIRETPELDILLLKGLKVLVVDDNEDCKILVTVIFEEYQAQIKTASSVDDAISMMDEWQPDVLISDICMREKDGYLLIRTIRKKEELEGDFVPAVVLTMYPEKGVEALGLDFRKLFSNLLNLMN